MKKILFLILFGILVIPLSCRTEFDSLEVESQHIAKAKRFAVFSKGSQFAKNGYLLDYSEAFGYLAQKYDSVNNSNISGLVNTKNIITHKSDKKLRSVLKSADFYVEFKLHSKTVYEENGDIWVLFPKIKNGKVIDLVAGLLTENETEVYYITLDKTSSLFLKNVDLFQKAFNKYFKIDSSGNIYTASTSARCGFPGSPACEIEEVIIIVGGGESGYSGGLPGGSDSPGGGCPIYIECIDDNMDGGGGGGGDNTNPNTPSNDPCAKAKAENTEAKSLLDKANVKSQKEQMVENIKSDKNEKAFSFGKDKDGNDKTTDIKTGTNENSVGISATNADITIEGGAHTHTPSLYDCFSAGDFYAFHGANSANSKFKYYYVFSEDAGYVMTITNPEKFKKFTENYPMGDYFDTSTGDWKDGTSIHKDFNYAKKQFINSGLDEDLAFEYATAMVMSKYDMGISLGKQDTSGNFGSVFVKENQIPTQVMPGVFIPISTFQKTDDCNLK